MAILRPGRPEAAEAQAVSDPLDSFLNVLNRDQRTAITIERTGRSEGSGSCRRVRFLRFERGSSRPPSEISNRSAVGFSEKIRGRSRGPRRRLACLMCRLGEVFIVGVCLLTIVRVPAVMSTPYTRHGKTNEQSHSHNPTENAPSYLHPCGHKHEEINKTYYKKGPRESNPSEIINHIIIRANYALLYAETFRDRYVEKTFGVRFKTNLTNWGIRGYDWLPAIPKSLGDRVDLSRLESKTLDEFLVQVYRYMQMFAVGLEQVVADQKRTEGEFQENFRVMEVRLRHVLCEIQDAMIQRDLSPLEQVPRSIMGQNFRNMEQKSFRNLRDWFIFRDLMNGLEYVIQVLTFFEKELREAAESS